MLKGRKKLNRAISRLVEKKGDEVKAVYTDGLGVIIRGTPAREGRARNNWFLSSSAPSNKETNTKSISGQNSFAQLGKMPANVLGKKLFFTNNVPYIGLLEYGGYPKSPMKGSYFKENSPGNKFQIVSINGFSKQAPGGWVRTAIKLMQAKIKTL